MWKVDGWQKLQQAFLTDVEKLKIQDQKCWHITTYMRHLKSMEKMCF